MKIHSNKLNHMRGVAEYMYRHAPEYGLEPEKAYVVGLLHDIGYINEEAAKRENGQNHEQYGAELLRRTFIPRRSLECDVIAYHGTKPEDVPEGIRDSRLMHLLWEADMSIDKYGREVGFKGRLEDIGHRYGFDSEAYKTAKATVDFLERYQMERVVFYKYDKEEDKYVPVKESNLEHAADVGRTLMRIWGETPTYVSIAGSEPYELCDLKILEAPEEEEEVER